MEFTLASGDFAAALSTIKGVIPSRSTIPILNNVLLDTSSGKLRIVASCLEMEASIHEPAEIVSHGMTTIHGQVLFGIVKALPKTKLVTLKMDGDRAVLSCGKSVYNLGTLPCEDFPGMAGVGADAITVRMPASALKSALDATRGSVSTDATRYYLQGVHLANDGGRLAFVSTDGHRLVCVESDVIDLPSKIPHIIIPSAAVAVIASMIDGSKDMVTITASGKKIAVESGQVNLIAKLIEGEFPDYRRVIPRYNAEPNFKATASEMDGCVSRISSILTGEQRINPAARISTNGSSIEIAMGGQNSGIETVDAEIFDPTMFGVSISYLSDMLGLWPGTATLSITAPDAGSPILITSPDVPNQTQVIMPMR
jgi:DNA polymerase-3 subunit beta